METNGNYNRRIEELECQLTRQAVAIQELGAVLGYCVQEVLRRDQAVSLNRLKERIMVEVEHARSREIDDSIAFRKEKFAKGLAKFIGGTISGMIAGQKNPLLTDLSPGTSVFEQKAPFDTILVAIGKRGLPQDVGVIPLSRLARRYNRSELELKQVLAKHGYLLMTREQFALLVDSLIEKVINGLVSLPVRLERIASDLAEHKW